MNEPYTDKELRRIRREDHRSPPTLRFLATIARLQARVEEAERELERHRAAASRTILRRDVLRLGKERDALQARVEEAERNWDTATEAERVTHREWDKTLDELAEAEALAERRKKALVAQEDWENHWPSCDDCYAAENLGGSETERHDRCERGALLLGEAASQRRAAIEEEGP